MVQNYLVGFIHPDYLSLVINFVLIVLRQCGHVICNSCIDMFVKKSKKCYVCEEKTKTKDVIDMSPEGTGFASASKKAVAEKFNLAFQ
jgi:nitric oxide synthase-interacting protein